MGWSFGWGSFRSLLSELTKGWTNDNAEGGMSVTSVCLAKCFRGNPAFAGTLWSVWEQTFMNPDGTVNRPPQRFIRCDLLQCQTGEWGYKDMCESMGPVVCNCPEKYLRMVPVENGAWRERVAEYHVQRRQRAAAKKARKAA